ncbi:MAG: hypothetical protein HYU66_09720 [Armatimonadetes bacterium]|nr:hypothetical protein [Armatimonadota bacterium]
MAGTFGPSIETGSVPGHPNHLLAELLLQVTPDLDGSNATYEVNLEAVPAENTQPGGADYTLSGYVTGNDVLLALSQDVGALDWNANHYLCVTATLSGVTMKHGSMEYIPVYTSPNGTLRIGHRGTAVGRRTGPNGTVGYWVHPVAQVVPAQSVAVPFELSVWLADGKKTSGPWTAPAQAFVSPQLPATQLRVELDPFMLDSAAVANMADPWLTFRYRVVGAPSYTLAHYRVVK